MVMRLTRRQSLLACGGAIAAFAAKPDLPEQWRAIARDTDGVVGASALHLSSGARFSLNGEARFPLASICKLPLAMHILALVEERKLAFTDEIEILPQDVWSGVSVIEKQWPAQRRYSLRRLVELVVAQSDNTAEEALFRIGGQAPALTARLRQWKVEGVRLDRSERQCDLDRNGVAAPPQSEWTDAGLHELITRTPDAVRYRALKKSLGDPRDTGTPDGTTNLLARLFRGELLSPASTTLLIDILKATTTFPHRLKGLLPPGTVVAHKTGSIGPWKGLALGTNDSGVIFLPGGAQVAVSVYLKNSTRDDGTRDRVIARIAKAAFERWS
jgi:beta-lactamase class A